MLVGVMFSGIVASLTGFVASVLAGHALLHSLLIYSLAGTCGALAFILAVATVLDLTPDSAE